MAPSAGCVCQGVGLAVCHLGYELSSAWGAQWQQWSQHLKSFLWACGPSRTFCCDGVCGSGVGGGRQASCHGFRLLLLCCFGVVPRVCFDWVPLRCNPRVQRCALVCRGNSCRNQDAAPMTCAVRANGQAGGCVCLTPLVPCHTVCGYPVCGQQEVICVSRGLMCTACCQVPERQAPACLALACCMHHLQLAYMHSNYESHP